MADAHLKESGYKILKDDLSIKNTEIVKGAEYAKRHHTSLQGIAEAAKDAKQVLNADDWKDVQRVTVGVLTSKPGQDEESKAADLKATFDRVKKHATPEQARRLDVLREKADVQHKAEKNANVTAGNSERRAATTEVPKQEVIEQKAVTLGALNAPPHRDKYRRKRRLSRHRRLPTRRSSLYPR